MLKISVVNCLTLSVCNDIVCILGVVNGQPKTLQDGETGNFFSLIFSQAWDFLSLPCERIKIGKQLYEKIWIVKTFKFE